MSSRMPNTQWIRLIKELGIFSPSLSSILLTQERIFLSENTLCMYIIYNTFSDSGGEIHHFDMEYHFSWVYTKFQIQIVSGTVFILKVGCFVKNQVYSSTFLTNNFLGKKIPQQSQGKLKNKKIKTEKSYWKKISTVFLH